ncbi:hypothetical protein [Streptomyces sp. NPDC093093]|uniref:hypothetical protein n=1 Tax=Streptomyces sp. NPDC093093 TaxID=3366025 RepID=UPI0038282F95
MLERTRRKDRIEVTFVLPADAPPGPVGVVGDFNDWQPGVHTLTPRKDGNRAVTVALPAASAHSFRYLAARADRSRPHGEGFPGWMIDSKGSASLSPVLTSWLSGPRSLSQGSGLRGMWSVSAVGVRRRSH